MRDGMQDGGHDIGSMNSLSGRVQTRSTGRGLDHGHGIDQYSGRGRGAIGRGYKTDPSGRAGFSASKKNAHRERGERYENRILDKGLVNGNSGEMNAPGSSLWEPPVDLQRIVIPGPEIEYFLDFPLELTNKDYLRRVLEIVARGVQSRVLQITSEQGLKAIPPHSQQDVHYLLKQVMGNNSDIADDGQRIRMLYSDQLRCPHDKLRDSAEYVFTQRNLLFHLESDVSRNSDTERLFGAARELLECFGRAGVYALQRLQELQHQYQRHQQFRRSRATVLGWVDEAGNFHSTTLTKTCF